MVLPATQPPSMTLKMRFYFRDRGGHDSRFKTVFSRRCFAMCYIASVQDDSESHDLNSQLAIHIQEGYFRQIDSVSHLTKVTLG